MVDKDNVSLPARSEKMFTLSSLYDANQELLAEKRNGDDAFFNELVATGVDYWTTVSRFMPDWQRVRNGLRPIELRQENISTHSVVLRALGGLGAEVMKQFPTDWKNRLADLTAVNWSKKNREWENVCLVANSVVSNRQARLATKAYLKRKLGLSVSESEGRSIEQLVSRIEPNPVVDSRSVFAVNQPRRQPIHPVEIRIGTEVVKVTKSNQIPVLVGNWILKQGKTIPRIQNFVHEADSGFPRAAQTKQLVNGWYVEIGDSQDVLLQKARRLLDACGFREVRLEILLEDGTVRTA